MITISQMSIETLAKFGFVNVRVSQCQSNEHEFYEPRPLGSRYSEFATGSINRIIHQLEFICLLRMNMASLQLGLLMNRLLVACLSLGATLANGESSAKQPLEPTIRKARLSKAQTARVVQTNHHREILLFGALRVECGPEHFLREVLDIKRFKQGPEVLAVGLFHPQKASLADLENLTFAPSEIDSLRNCKPGACPWRLSTASMRQLNQVRWNEPNARRQADRIVREEIVGVVSLYQQQGISSLAPYNDKQRTLDVSLELRQMLDASAGIFAETPQLQERLNGFPNVPLPGVEDLFYWSLEKMGPKQVFSVTHMTLYRDGPKLFIVGMQIYGNHYLDGMLSLSRLESDPTQSDQAWLEYSSRSRLGLLEGPAAGMRRMLLEEALRRTMQRYLLDTAQRVRQPNLAQTLR